MTPPRPLVLASSALTALLAATVLPATTPLAPAASAAPAAPPGPTSSILISEIANGGAGATSNANRVSNDDFMEIANFGTAPVDVSGWRLLRCGQTGDAYGPQKVLPAGTVLAPGETYTVGSPTSTNKAVVKRDADYDASGSTLHEFGFGAWLETPDYQVVDRVGFYHDSVFSDCGRDDRALERPLDHRLNQSHQRVATTGDPEVDWVVATRTPDAPNATGPLTDTEAPGPVKITEVTNGVLGNNVNQYVELTNTGTEPVDITGYKLYRCGENGTTYLQNGSLPRGLLAPGASYLVAHTSAGLGPGVAVDATYTTGMHFRDFGVMLTRRDDRIVDRVGFYADRNSICTDGDPVTEDLDALRGEAYHRVADTGDNAQDFLLAQERSPRVASARADLTPPAPNVRGPIRISELAGGGPAGDNDEIIEIANYGDTPVDLDGWSLTRCYATGQGGAPAQVADLGDVTLAPGEVWLATDDGAPAELRALADAVYGTGLADTTYGAYVADAQGRFVDAVAVYETVEHSPCNAFGSTLRGFAKSDLGESYQRARSTADDEENFVVAQRTPGVLAEHTWVDPTEPLPGELDPVSVDRVTAPGTPQVTTEETGAGHRATVTTEDADSGELQVSVRAAQPLPTTGARVLTGTTPRKVPATLSIDGERPADAASGLTTESAGSEYPFQRFEVPVAEVPADGVELTWTGTAPRRDEVQAYTWDGTAWQLADAAVPSADGDLTLVAHVPASSVLDGRANVLVIDGPRTRGGAVDEVGVEDQAFLDPWQYDVALNHMTDTQFLSEGFRDVFRRMVTWVVANADARKIGYSTNGGDIIENWIAGNADPVRARKEFAAAKRIMQLLNDADVPNGVLPGNHDNLWGRDNRLYNEYFGPSMYSGESWWGASYGPDDNSAHYDFVEVDGLDLLVLSLPYAPTQAQIDWGRAVAAAHPRHNVVLVTHSYLNTEGDIENRNGRYTARGEDIWSDLVAPSDNVFLVLGGHYHGVATKYGDPVTGEQVDATEIAGDVVAVRNVGETGRRVVQMLADYQGYRSTQPEPRADTLDRDTGFQRLLQLDLDAELMAVNAYSPHLDTFEAWKYDEPAFRGANARYDARDDEFVAKIDLLARRSVATEGWGLTSRSTEVGTATVPAGSPARVDLAGVARGSVVVARVTDPTGQVVASAPVTVGTATGPGTPGGPGTGGPGGPGTPGATATTTTLGADRAGQVLGAPEQERVLVRATVAASGGTGPVSGSLLLTADGRPLGTATVTAGRAELRLPDLPVGTHRVLARFEPAAGSSHAASTSEPLTVTVSAPEAARSTTTLTASGRTQRYAAEPARRVSLTATVASARGAAGTVEVRRSGVLVASAPLTGGSATVLLPGDLPVGRHELTATYVPADPAAVAPSTSASTTVVVQRASTTARARLLDGPVGARERGRLEVAVSATGLVPTGTVTVTVRGGGRVRTLAATLVDGRAVLRLPRLVRGSYRVLATYGGSDVAAGDRAPVVRLRVR
ncbi:lamin tail domain-containing protein [Nocardioides sp. SOB77]|uniref:Lamin tail domain-containing protein n=1 Tax=Nocardioides oceani TaxID=3058369 RepID=A0ABT8FFE0_9ACTN|nr:lamin tail domain-containing protein [Nocardioides oceani]MDN4173291.1 lamin tail domain-containing protein [Nocardioides oceani]